MTSSPEWDAVLLAVEGPEHTHTLVVFEDHATGICTVCHTYVKVP